MLAPHLTHRDPLELAAQVAGLVSDFSNGDLF